MENREVIQGMRKLLANLPQMIKESGYKDVYIMEKVGLSKTNYYRRLNKTELFSLDELEKIVNLIEK